MTQERTGVSEGASVQATPAPPENADTTPTGPLHPADSPAIGTTFTLEAAKAEIARLIDQHDGEQRGEHRAPTAIELGKKQIADIQADLLALHGRDTGPVVQLHGLNVIPTSDDDHVALVYSGVAGA